MANPNISKIREAILKNRGGLKNANDSQIMTLWGALDAETKKQYLDSVKTKNN